MKRITITRTSDKLKERAGIRPFFYGLQYDADWDSIPKMSNNNTKTSPKLSIIVPAWDVERYLGRCLDSLTCQTIEDIEIIVVDDKSTDGTLGLMREYERRDPRVRVIELGKNGGAAVARNAGLAMAAGEYIGFVDSDDFVDPDFYEKLYSRAKETDADIVKGEVCETKFDGRIKTRGGPRFSKIRKNKANFRGSWSSAIYRHDFLRKNKLDFPVGIITGQDTVFLRKCVILANKVELVTGTSYHYIRREGSLDSRILGTDKLKSKIDAVNLTVDFINDKIAGDRETYDIVFGHDFVRMLFKHYPENFTFDGRMMACRMAIEIYAKCRYKADMNGCLGETLSRLLSTGDEIGIFEYLNKISREGTECFKLFGFIPLLKIERNSEAIKIRLFNSIPFLKIRKKVSGDHWRLFFLIPIMKTTR